MQPKTIKSKNNNIFVKWKITSKTIKSENNDIFENGLTTPSKKRRQLKFLTKQDDLKKLCNQKQSKERQWLWHRFW